MTNIKIAYVVLHYKNAEITTKCLKYLNEIMGDESAAIVVDNYSQNDSLDEIQKNIGVSDKIYFIRSDTNLGFANGNNLGYKYAREELNANCIIVMNNDIFISDIDFEKKLRKSNLVNNYSIIAPDVVTLSGKHQNPFRCKKLSTWRLFVSMSLQYLYSFTFRIGHMIPWIVRKYRSEGKINTQKEYDISGNIIPHGSCVIFTSKYTEREHFAFVPATFFYGEEDLLYDYCMFRNHSIVYCPELKVTHAEKQSTGAISQSELTILRFRSQNKASSLRICLKYRLFPNKFKHLF